MDFSPAQRQPSAARPWRRVLFLTALVALAASPAGATSRLGHPGYLVIAAGRDSSAGFHWQDGPAPGRRSLVWPAGVLSLPDSLVTESFGADDLAVPCGPELAGLGNSGFLELEDGVYRITEPLLLDDGSVRLFLNRGQLEIRGQRLRYRAPAQVSKDPRAGYVFLAGMVVLILVLLRRAAVRLRARR